MKIDITAEPATPPEQGIKVRVRNGTNMDEKKCIIYYDLIINGNEYHRTTPWPIKVRRNERDGEFCCGEFETLFTEGGFSHDSYTHSDYQVGEGYYSYGEYYFEPFKFCPYCGAQIEYVLKYKYKMVNKPKDEWQRESFFGEIE